MSAARDAVFELQRRANWSTIGQEDAAATYRLLHAWLVRLPGRPGAATLPHRAAVRIPPPSATGWSKRCSLLAARPGHRSMVEHWSAR